HHLELRAGRLDVEGVEVEELAEDARRAVAQRLQQDRDRHLAAPVDAEEHDVLRVELEVEPGAAIGDDPRREQELSGRMRLAAVVLEEHAGRAVQLGDDHALGAVDDERAGGGHERDLAHVDLLLLHLLGGRLGRVLVEDHQAHLGAQRARVREAALLALLHVERRLAQEVADELEARIARMADDREDRGKRSLQPLVAARLRRHVRLEKAGVGLELGRDEERRLLDDRPLREALADAFTLGQRIGHEGSKMAAGQRKDPANARSFICPESTGGVSVTPPGFQSSTSWELRNSAVPYLISALAPASISFLRTASASALETASLTGFGAPSTRSLASLRPRLVTSRTALMTFTLLSPTAVSITVNSVFSSALAPAAAPPAAGAATATAAAAETPNFSSMSLMSCESSRTVILPISSRI